MERVVLKAKYIDVVKIMARDSALPFFIAIIFALFTSQNKLNVLVFAIPMFLLVTVFVSFLLSNSPSVVLVENGIIFQDWRGRDGLFSPWESEIKIESRYIKKTGMHVIKNVTKNKTIRVFSSVFSYPEVKQFINKYCPSNHELRKVSASDS
jgi:hypothetical protein